MSTYVIAPTGADIMHFGKGHDDNPPGRGSGRYAWGSGNGEGAKQKKNKYNYGSTIDKKKDSPIEAYDKLKADYSKDANKVVAYFFGAPAVGLAITTIGGLALDAINPIAGAAGAAAGLATTLYGIGKSIIESNKMEKALNSKIKEYNLEVVQYIVEEGFDIYPEQVGDWDRLGEYERLFDLDIER